MPLDSAGFHFNPGQQRVWDRLYTSTARFCLVYGGSRSGKTFLTVYTLIVRALKSPHSKHLIVRQEAAAARASLARGNMATIRTVLRLCFPGVEPIWNEKYGYYEFSNGAEIWIGGLNDEKAMERVLGNEYASIYINEASEVKYSAFILLRSRLAQVCEDINGNEVVQRFYVDLNPTTRMHWTFRLWREGMDPNDNSPVSLDQYKFEVINPHDNRANLTGDYLADLANLPEAARKRFLDGEYAADDENALWKRSYFSSKIRFLDDGRLPVEMRRIVVAIDPAASSDPGSDETGVITAGIGADGLGYILGDDSGRYRPEEWARKAIASYHRWKADLVIGEKNNGGDMVESVLRAQAPNVSYKSVWASRGKITRAEPVAAMYELGKVRHLVGLDELEDQCCAVTSGFDRKAQGWSPDRVDALVWAMTELFPELSAPPMPAHVPTPRFSMI